MSGAGNISDKTYGIVVSILTGVYGSIKENSLKFRSIMFFHTKKKA